jgi:hypothetical protein
MSKLSVDAYGVLTERVSVLTERIRRMEQARKIQAKEYKRRLNDLNGEAKRIRDIQTEYVPREVFDRMINAMNDKIQIITDYKNADEGKNQLTKYIPWIITIIFGVLAYFKK